MNIDGYGMRECAPHDNKSLQITSKITIIKIIVVTHFAVCLFITKSTLLNNMCDFALACKIIATHEVWKSNRNKQLLKVKQTQHYLCFMFERTL